MFTAHAEAIKNAINQIKHDEVKPKILLSDIGMITETDVILAKASNAVLIAFNVKPSKEAKKISRARESLIISSYNIIYEVLDFIKSKNVRAFMLLKLMKKLLELQKYLEIFKVSGTLVRWLARKLPKVK